MSVVVLIAAGLAGGLVGFIFSVPYVNIQTRVVEPENVPAAAGDAPRPVLEQLQPLLKSNSNLEKISEWLTTMLVGVGLSQINSVFQGLKEFGDFLAPMDVVKVAGVDVIVGYMRYAGPALLVAGLTLGFLSVYLYTRLRISYLFDDVEREFGARAAVDAKLTAAESKALTSIAADSETVKESAGMKVMASASQASVRDALSVMTQLLYDVQNKGFQKAIEMGNALISTPAVSVARFWFLMAAAHGQQYTDQKATASRDQLRAIRAELYAIDKALELDPRYKRSLRNMLDSGNTDNDLKSFAEDDDFLSRLN